MLEALRYRFHALRHRIERLERREMRELRRWLESTENLLQLTALIVVPLVIGSVTWISNISPIVSFLVYPPLASGTYTLFADPGGRYSSPKKFVGGMTIGALSGWVALELTARFWYTIPSEQFQVHAGAAALGIFLTGVLTWVFDAEEPTAFSAALLVLITGGQRLTYVSGIIVSSVVVAAVFVVWRRRFFHERARYLFQSIRGDDQILVPLRGRSPESLALFAARIAAAHEAGRIVLLETVPPETIEETVSQLESGQLNLNADRPDELSLDDLSNEAEAQLTSQVLAGMEDIEDLIHQHLEVPCEYVVAIQDGSVGETVLKTARDEGCDLIVCPYEADDEGPTRFVRTVLSGPIDAIVFRSANGRTAWQRTLVLVRSAGDVANAMIDFAARLQAGVGSISACTCISRSGQRRTAEIMLENLVETVTQPVELRISHGSVETFLSSNGPYYDLAIIGASTDRNIASRFLSAPTFERIDDIDCDLAIVHRG